MGTMGWDRDLRAGTGTPGLGQEYGGWDRDSGAGRGTSGLGWGLWGWDKDAKAGTGQGQGPQGWIRNLRTGTGTPRSSNQGPQGWDGDIEDGTGTLGLGTQRAGTVTLEPSPLSQATEEQIKLLRLQRHLQEELDKPYLDLSLHDTVATLILDGHHKRAEQLYRDFRIPDKRWGQALGGCSVLRGHDKKDTHSLGQERAKEELLFLDLGFK